jgi:hypothetical protein
MNDETRYLYAACQLALLSTASHHQDSLIVSEYEKGFVITVMHVRLATAFSRYQSNIQLTREIPGSASARNSLTVRFQPGSMMFTYFVEDQ